MLSYFSPWLPTVLEVWSPPSAFQRRGPAHQKKLAHDLVALETVNKVNVSTNHRVKHVVQHIKQLYLGIKVVRIYLVAISKVSLQTKDTINTFNQYNQSIQSVIECCCCLMSATLSASAPGNMNSCLFMALKVISLQLFWESGN